MATNGLKHTTTLNREGGEAFTPNETTQSYCTSWPPGERNKIVLRIDRGAPQHSQLMVLRHQSITRL